MTTQTETRTLKDIVMELFEPGKEITIMEVLDHVEAIEPGTDYASVLGVLSRAVSAKTLTKDGMGKYTFNENKEDVATVIVTTEPLKDMTFSIDGIHPLLNRELTENEKMIVRANEKLTSNVFLTKEQEILIKQMSDGTITKAMFFGDPGNGKTTVGRKIADKLKLPVYSQNYGVNSEELDILGGFIPDEENGGFKWVDGQFTIPFRNGGVYIAEEPNYAKPGVLGIKNNALDAIGQIVLRNGEVVQRHPAFRYIGCMNVGLAGTQRMNLAFLNRMEKIMKFEPLSKQKQVEIIEQESGYRNRQVIKRMVEVGALIKNKIKKESIDNAEISIRNLIAWARDVRYTGNIIASAKPTIVWAVCMEEDELHEEILKDIIEPRFIDVQA